MTPIFPNQFFDSPMQAGLSRVLDIAGLMDKQGGPAPYAALEVKQPKPQGRVPYAEGLAPEEIDSLTDEDIMMLVGGGAPSAAADEPMTEQERLLEFLMKPQPQTSRDMARDTAMSEYEMGLLAGDDVQDMRRRFDNSMRDAREAAYDVRQFDDPFARGWSVVRAERPLPWNTPEEKMAMAQRNAVTRGQLLQRADMAESQAANLGQLLGNTQAVRAAGVEGIRQDDAQQGGFGRGGMKGFDYSDFAASPDLTGKAEALMATFASIAPELGEEELRAIAVNAFDANGSLNIGYVTTLFNRLAPSDDPAARARLAQQYLTAMQEGFEDIDPELAGQLKGIIEGYILQGNVPGASGAGGGEPDYEGAVMRLRDSGLLPPASPQFYDPTSGTTGGLQEQLDPEVIDAIRRQRQAQ